MTSIARRLGLVLVPGLAVGLSAGACGSGSTASTDPQPGEDTGQAILAITSVPANVNCVQITVTGSRTDVRVFDVVPGNSSTLTLKGLPTGNVTFLESAFPAACASVGPASVASWVSNAVSATLVPGVAASVQIVLRQNGQAVVTSDFQDGGGVLGAGGSSGTGGVTGAGGGTCVPIPQTTACGGRECGSVSNGCSGTYNCGVCDTSDPCFPSHCNAQGLCAFTSLPCLVAGTPIAMADGTTVPIERVRIGDQVLAYDVRTGVTRPQLVSQTYHHAADENHEGMVLINGTVHATGNHPVYANGRFVRADRLAAGDALIQLGSSGAATNAIATLEMSEGEVETFNLEVEGDHDYFAGGILVHNKPLCP
jgi:hypothetical protein